MIGQNEQREIRDRKNIPLNGRDALRKRMKALRKEHLAHQAEDLSAWSRQIAQRVMRMDECAKAKRVMCYYSLSGEVQTAELLRALIAEGKEVYLPVTEKNREMNAVRLRDADAVHAGAFRVMEPDGDETVEPNEIDLILIPGLAFDRTGGRMGYGAGCYDRFLPKCRGVFAALAFEFQMVGSVPTDAHDVPMHYVVTERTVYDCRREQKISRERNE